MLQSSDQKLEEGFHWGSKLCAAVRKFAEGAVNIPDPAEASMTPIVKL